MKSNIIKASVKGQLDIMNNLPNQDCVKVKRYKNTITTVVSDGLGSHRLSHIGSKYACDSVVEVIKRYHNTDVINSNLEQILVDIHTMWVKKLRNYNIEKCGTTCLFAHIKKDQVIVAQLGDGAIFVNDEKVFHKDERLYANETHSLRKNHTTDSWKWKLYDKTSTPIRSLMLCTDGVSEDLNPTKINVFNEWLFDLSKSLLRNFTMKKELRNWSNKNNGDDKSIVYISIGE